MTTPDLARVGVVVVEYHSGGLTASVATAASGLGCTVAVADNSGTYDGPGIVTTMPGNVGFGAACNAAVRSLPVAVDTIVLWNPDAVIEPEGLTALVDAVVDGGWAAVAPALQTSTLRTAGFAYPSPWREPFVVLRELRPPLRARGTAAGSPAPDCVVDSPPRRFGSAAFLVADRRTFEQVGGFDEEFFLYVEDLDLWHRLRCAGHRCGFLPSVVAAHAAAGGSDASAARRAVLRWLGVELFARRHNRSWRGLRRTHRLAARFLPHDGDAVVDLVRQGLHANTSPEALQREVAQLAGTDRETTA